jgi:hypothetical protein
VNIPNTRYVLSLLWKDRLMVTEYRNQVDANGVTEMYEVVTTIDEPCRLSFSSLDSVDRNDSVSPVRQTVKVFCRKDLAVPAGSKISIARDGVTLDFKQSGEPGRHGSHQEIVLIPYEGNA